MAIATARSTPLKPLAASASAALLAAVVAALTTDADYALMSARFATTALAVGVAFSFDDPASASTGAVPYQLRYRRLNRVLYMFAAFAFLLATVLWLIGAVLPADQAVLPIPRLVLEASGQAAAGLAIAAYLARTEPKPGRIAAATLLGIVAASWLLPGPLRPWLHPDDPLWHAGQRIWTSVLATSLLLLTALSWDSRTRMPVRTIRR